MPKSDMIRARVEPRLKSDVESVFKQLGLSASQAIGLFYSQVKMHKGLPFQVRIPNKTTRRVFELTEKGKGIKVFRNKKEFFEDLGLR